MHGTSHHHGPKLKKQRKVNVAQNDAIWLIAHLKKKFDLIKGRDYTYQTVVDRTTDAKLAQFVFTVRAMEMGAVAEAKDFVAKLVPRAHPL